MSCEIGTRLSVAPIRLQPLERVIGHDAALDAPLCLCHELVNSRHRRTQRPRRNNTERPRNLDFHPVLVGGRVGHRESGNDAGAGAGFPMASIAASFIFWFSVTVYPLSSPRTTTDSADANPNAEATMIDRFANATWRPLSR